MIGHGDLDRSRNWFAACLDELIAVIRRLNARVLLLLGAVLPSILNDRFMVREFVARNGIIQNRCFTVRNRSLVEYTRPGHVLLIKGGPIATYFDKEGRLSVKGRDCRRPLQRSSIPQTCTTEQSMPGGRWTLQGWAGWCSFNIIYCALSCCIPVFELSHFVVTQSGFPVQVWVVFGRACCFKHSRSLQGHVIDIC